jgi:tRNA (guanine37-N1)-methyltransferase
MQIDILTLFPELFTTHFETSILKRARDAGLLNVFVHNIRDYAQGKHRVTDEPPYGGGGGMVLKPEPIFDAVETIIGLNSEPDHESHQFPIILLTPQGRLFNQSLAQELATEKRLILICGRYEGVDERVRQQLVTDEISIGDYVLTGGELAALIITDSVTRLQKGVLGAEGAAESDSHAFGLLEGPHYTRPETFRGMQVPDVLRSGHAANIRRWRREQALRRTWQRRPDLLLTANLDEEDKQFLMILAEESIQGM